MFLELRDHLLETGPIVGIHRPALLHELLQFGVYFTIRGELGRAPLRYHVGYPVILMLREGLLIRQQFVEKISKTVNIRLKRQKGVSKGERRRREGRGGGLAFRE